jgi:signal transduction histidine kinase
MSLHPTVVDEVLRHMEGLVGAQLEEKELSYTYRCDDPSLVACADAAKIQQIVLNLLANAIKFTDRRGSITLDCGLEADTIAIHVVDTGPGIPADKLDAIFQPFVQLKSKGSVTAGTGLGLPISRKLATAMGGSLNATSEFGRGSNFTLRLLRAPRPDNTPRASQPPLPSS